jgi:predicted small metal-binding protein
MISMAKSISCADAGADCSWSASAETEEELMEKVAVHVKEEHKELKVTPELVEKVKSLIKEV